jgi:diadenosine tetraphosphate (Ap4A) HIT family hydrolase
MSSIEKDYILYDGQEMQIVVPEYALSSGSLKVCPKENHFNQQEAFVLLQKIASVWKEQGIDNYLIYRKSDELSWEIVPYYGNHSSLWNRFNSIVKQLFVLACVSFDRCFVSLSQREITFKQYQNQFSTPLPSEEKTTRVATDAFCNPEVVARQCVLSGQYIDVLYNYAPINAGKEQLHFLLVPKAHREGFDDLTAEEYAEVVQLTEKLCSIFSTTSYQYHKTGALAGQTVSHWHQHLVFVEPGYSWLGKLSVLFRMAIPPTPLAPEELEMRVNKFKGLLA